MVVACTEPVAPLPGSCRDCNVVLISIDTLRADHLGSYGYSRPTSPFLDSLAEEGLLFVERIEAKGIARDAARAPRAGTLEVCPGQKNAGPRE